MARTLAVIARLEVAIAGTFLVLMVVLIFAGGVSRMLGAPLNWTTDLATCLFAWACFFCADVAWRNGGLMSIEVLAARLPPRLRRLLDYVNYLIISAFLIYMAGAGVWLSYASRARSFQGIPWISYSWVTMSLPVGACLLLLTTVIKLQDELRAARAPARPAG